MSEELRHVWVNAQYFGILPLGEVLQIKSKADSKGMKTILGPKLLFIKVPDYYPTDRPVTYIDDRKTWARPIGELHKLLDDVFVRDDTYEYPPKGKRIYLTKGRTKLEMMGEGNGYPPIIGQDPRRNGAKVRPLWTPVNDPSRLAKLTPEEDKAWEYAFAYYVEESGMSDEEADERAWEDIQEQFPRLKEYTGIERDTSVRDRVTGTRAAKRLKETMKEWKRRGKSKPGSTAPTNLEAIVKVLAILPKKFTMVALAEEMAQHYPNRMLSRTSLGMLLNKYGLAKKVGKAYVTTHGVSERIGIYERTIDVSHVPIPASWTEASRPPRWPHEGVRDPLYAQALQVGMASEVKSKQYYTWFDVGFGDGREDNNENQPPRHSSSQDEWDGYWDGWNVGQEDRNIKITRFPWRVEEPRTAYVAEPRGVTNWVVSPQDQKKCWEAVWEQRGFGGEIVAVKETYFTEDAAKDEVLRQKLAARKAARYFKLIYIKKLDAEAISEEER